MAEDISDLSALLIYALPMVLIFLLYVFRTRRQHQEFLREKHKSIEAGLTEPASLHPSIDPLKCTGCGACVAACPEQPEHKVLGLIHGKAELISPTECIGHGACFAACPHDAIQLVFGTETRGVDIPHLDSNFETNIKGIFIAGELGGMGLIRNAIEQGRQAMDSICKRIRKNSAADLDVFIVGAGPAGFSASLAALNKGLRSHTIEQEDLGGTVAQYPRGKLVMTQPAILPGAGKMPFKETSKERLLEFWQKVERESDLKINYRERMESISATDDGFEVKTTQGHYTTQTILLAIGRRGTPRKLEVPGEDLPKVTYRLMDPEQYAGERVLVVGGGDSALEAACSIAEVEGTDVTLSYRSAAFSRAKPANRERVEKAETEKNLRVLLQSNVVEITDEQVTLDQDGTRIELPNDSVIINVGGILPTPILKSVGIRVDTKFGAA